MKSKGKFWHFILLAFKYIVADNDSKKTWWDILVILLAVYNCFSIPYILAFPSDWAST